MRGGTATSNDSTSPGVHLRFHSDTGIPAAAATIQPQRARPAGCSAPAASAGFNSATGCASYKGGKGRLSVWNPCSRQTASGREPLFAWQIYRCGRIPSRDGSEGSLYRQDFPGAVRRARYRNFADAGYERPGYCSNSTVLCARSRDEQLDA
jgi:hypothetical protein